MRASPRCSVIIPTYNRVTLLQHTLDSLLRQTLPPDDFEVVVADDGSSDGTDELVARYARRLNLTYRYQPDEGFRAAKARNLGLRAARGPVAVFVDSGVLLASDALEVHCTAHEASTTPLAVTGYVWGYADEHQVPPSRIAVDDVDRTISEIARDDRYRDKRELYYERYGERLDTLMAPWVVFWTCNASAGTDLIRDVGMFDEAFQSWGGEDLDLAYRLHRAGATFVLRRDAVALHYPHTRVDWRLGRPNNRYFAEKYDTPITRLRADHDVFVLEQAIRELGLPDCAEYEAAGGNRQPSAAGGRLAGRAGGAIRDGR